ncbi:hypothetical protein K7A42_03350 [Agrobacterium sp. InxBP2]|uniref:hypothetical protein n=1 Tax=Agrobacterium sp. InxBP2 TaxID=2870329 RepID=UPI00249EA6F9|nr:hypothetical protein [Agrobacterium sp. InxBP2]MCW8279909.1 hypothetical protein [Agrobacterium sp. InxBP2]
MQSEKWNLNRLDLWAEVALNLLNEAGAVFKGDDSYLAPRPEAAPPAPSVAVKAGPLAHALAAEMERMGLERPNGDILHDALSRVLPALSAQVQDVAEENWRDDPAQDERWNAGIDFAMTQLCEVLKVDPQSINWDCATETLEGDVQSQIHKVLAAAHEKQEG